MWGKQVGEQIFGRERNSRDLYTSLKGSLYKYFFQGLYSDHEKEFEQWKERKGSLYIDRLQELTEAL